MTVIDVEEKLEGVLPPFDKKKDRPFVLIPVELLINGDISPCAKILYALLKKHMGEDNTHPVRPAQKILAASMGVNEKTVRRYMIELEEWGLVTPIRMGSRQTNRYWVRPVYAILPRRVPLNIGESLDEEYLDEDWELPL